MNPFQNAPAPTLIHHCDSCAHNTTVPFSASIFSQSYYCDNCGHLSQGVRVQTVQEKADSEQTETLAELFDRRLHLARQVPPFPVEVEQYMRRGYCAEDAPRRVDESVSPDGSTASNASDSAAMMTSRAPVVYPSQHYTHTAHLAASSRRSGPPFDMAARTGVPPGSDRADRRQDREEYRQEAFSREQLLLKGMRAYYAIDSCGHAEEPASEGDVVMGE